MPPQRGPIKRRRAKPKSKPYTLPKSRVPDAADPRTRRPAPKPPSRPAPVTQPGPYRESERRQVEQHKRANRRRQDPSPPASEGGFQAPFRGSGTNIRAVEPFERSRRQARRKTRRAAEKLPSERLRRFPLLEQYTPRQARIITEAQRDRLREIRQDTGRGGRDVYMQSGLDDRRQLRLLSSLERQAAERNAELRGIPIGQDKAKPGGGTDLELAGLPIGELLEEAEERVFPRQYPGLRIAQVPYHLARATVEDPTGVAKSSVRTAVESVAGIPQGAKLIYEGVQEGVTQGDWSKAHQALGAIAKDYEDRYGPILEGNTAEFRRRVQDDYGVTPFVLDAAAAAPPVGQGLGLVARSGAYGRAVSALSKGQQAAVRGLGGGRAGRAVVRGLEEVRTTATRERPVLRQFAGEAGARPQATSRNLITAAGQRGLDVARRGRYQRQVSRAGFEDAGGGQLRPRPGATVQRMPALRPGEGEVLPLGGVREMPLLKRLTGRVARDIGGAKSTTRVKLLQRRAQTIRAIDKRVEKLDPPEQMALKYVRQLGLPAGADLATSVRELTRRLAQIRRGREKAGFRGTPAIARNVDDPANLADDAAAIRTILRDPEKHLTPRVREIADELRDITRTDEQLDPDLTPERALIRADRPQARLLGIERGPDVAFFQHVLEALERKVADGEDITPGTVTDVFGELADILPEARTARARELEGEMRRMAGAGGRRVETANRRVAVMRNLIRDRERRGQPLTTDEVRSVRSELALAQRDARRLRAERDRLMGERKGRNAEAERISGVKYGPDFRREDVNARLDDVRARLAAAEQRVKDLRQTVRTVEQEAPRVSDSMRTRLAELERDLTISREGRDAARQLLKIAKQVTRLTKSKKTMRLESAADFDAKVRRAAEESGLEPADYWMSSPRPRSEPGLATAGTGGRATARSKRYQGKLFDLGIEEVGPDALRRGAERNIKRRFSDALVSRNMQVHAFEWSRGDEGEGKTAGELIREFDERAIDPATVTLIAPRIARRRSLDPEGVERGRVSDTERDPGMDDLALAEIHEDLQESMIRPASSSDLEDLANEDIQTQAMNRYLVVQREVGDELEAATRPDGALARSLQIVLNQKPARILLGTLNAPWLMFQMASNTFLTGIGGGKNPLDIYGAHKWWRGLSDAEKEAVEVELGITHGQHWNIDQTRLGSTADKMGAARHMVNFYRGYKASRVGRLAHKANPLDAMFRVDEAQNNFFRKVLFYNQAKRSAYKRMGASWRGMDRAQGKLAKVLGLPTERMGAEIAKHGPEFEQHAKHVRDFLGDYLRYSDQERRLLSRNVMFYGYLRFSLRFAFYTMPVQHPVMTGILGNIGRMGAQEIKDLFGVPDNYRLPTSMLASAYFGDRQDVKKGQLKQIPFGRFNPFLNAVTQLESEQQLVGLMSPIYQAVADQFFEESSFTGREFRIKGEYPPNESVRPKDYYGSIAGAVIPGRPRNRILMRDLLSLAYPYRVAEKTGIPEVELPLIGRLPGTGVRALEGPQGDDTLLWDPRPTEYKTPELQESIRKSVREQRGRGAGEALVDEVMPLLRPRPTQAPRVVQRELEKQASQRRKPKRRRGSNPYGGTSSDASRYGAGSGSSSASRYGG